MTAPAEAPPVFVIRPSSGWKPVDLRELWAYRELAGFLVWRDLKVRYKQTAIGVLWAVLQPAAMMIVFTLIFGRLAGMPSDGAPYPVFALAALVPWQLFSRAISESTSSLVTDQRLITRVYFPRVLVPVATVLAALVDFAFGLVLLLGIMLAHGIVPGPAVLLLPALALLLLLAAVGTGLWLSALNVEYRDVAYTIPFLSQLWFFATPVVYSSRSIPSPYRELLGLNPMAGVVEGFRAALLGSGPPPAAMLAASALTAALLFLSGLVWFRRRERSFVDSIGSGGQ